MLSVIKRIVEIVIDIVILGIYTIILTVI
jgi:hypothetical protein